MDRYDLEYHDTGSQTFGNETSSKKKKLQEKDENTT